MGVVRAVDWSPTSEKVERAEADAGRVGRPSWRSRTAIIIFVAAAFLLQPLSVPLAHRAMKDLSDLPDASTQWQAYTARPAPDVLFVGDSETLTDVAPDRVGQLLSSELGRQVSVGKLGLPGETPDVIHVLVYRIMQRESRPKLLVYEVNELTMNSYWQWEPSYDLWLLSEPDPDYIQLALKVDRQPAWLIKAWLVPYFATAPVLAKAAECKLVEGSRSLAAKLLHHVPVELRPETPCEAVHHLGQAVIGNIDPYLVNYSYSKTREDYVRASLNLARSQTTAVMFIQLPARRLEQRAPESYAIFEGHVAALASELGVPSVNLVTSLESNDPDPGLYLDDGHLTDRGAVALAPAVAAAVAPLAAQALGP